MRIEGGSNDDRTVGKILLRGARRNRGLRHSRRPEAAAFVTGASEGNCYAARPNAALRAVLAVLAMKNVEFSRVLYMQERRSGATLRNSDRNSGMLPSGSMMRNSSRPADTVLIVLSTTRSHEITQSRAARRSLPFSQRGEDTG